eukprot:Sspe_Gene.63580::Locus_36607_Transcript_1_1_Confidence_1.000_Length_1571::g.63580::m.63580
MTVKQLGLLQLLLAFAAGLNPEWSRGSGWVPYPDTVGDGKVWHGQSQRCSIEYGRFLGRFHEAYDRVCIDGLSLDLVAIPTVTADYQEENEPTIEGCIRGCYKTAKLPWVDQTSNTSVGDPSAVGDLPGDSIVPLRSIGAVWNETGATCYCSTDILYRPITPAGKDLNEECQLMMVALPLGCLWSSHDPCIEANSDSCVWITQGDEQCCLDSKGYPWKTRLGFPWWVWMIGGFMLVASSIFGVLAHRQEPPRDSDDPGLSQELIEKHKQGYDALLQKLAVDLCPDDTISQCSVCLEDLVQSKCVLLPACKHKFHYKCMRKYVMHQVARGKKYPLCPNCRARVLLEDTTSGPDDEHHSDEERRGSYVSPAIPSSNRSFEREIELTSVHVDAAAESTEGAPPSASNVQDDPVPETEAVPLGSSTGTTPSARSLRKKRGQSSSSSSPRSTEDDTRALLVSDDASPVAE